MQSVIERERRGDYLGKTVQVVPHITDAIQDWIQRVSHTPVDGKEGVPDVSRERGGGCSWLRFLKEKLKNPIFKGTVS